MSDNFINKNNGNGDSDGVSVSKDDTGNINVYVNTPNNNNNKDKKGADKKKFAVYFVFGAIALIAVSVLRSAFITEEKNEFDPVTEVYGSLTSEEKLVLEGNFSVTNQGTLFKNPELSLFDRIFCMGFKKSSYCSEKPIHPLVNFVEDNYGVSYDDWRKKTGEHKTEDRIPGLRTKNKK